MDAVDVANQRCRTCLVNHKQELWRRVFDRSIFTALINAKLLYQLQVEGALVDVGKALHSFGVLAADNDAVKGGSAV